MPFEANAKDVKDADMAAVDLCAYAHSRLEWIEKDRKNAATHCNSIITTVLTGVIVDQSSISNMRAN